MDKYESIRAMSFTSLAAVLGIDLKRYKTRKGGEYYGPCPIHNPKNNSTSFSYAADGRFNCFSCGAKVKGSIDLTKLAKAVGFQAAVELLGATPIQTTSQVESASQEPENGQYQPLQKDTWKKFQVPCEWLEKRVPDAGIRERYGVFCYNNPARKSAYSGRVMIPVKDERGLLFGYLGRSISHGHNPDTKEEEPKYLFPKNLPKSHFLFGSAEIQSGMFGPVPLRRVWLVESPLCVLRFAMYQLPALSPFGWSLSPEQISLLANLAKGVVYLPDRNKKSDIGQCAFSLSRSIWVRCPELPDDVQDPEHLTLDQILALTR